MNPAPWQTDPQNRAGTHLAQDPPPKMNDSGGAPCIITLSMLLLFPALMLVHSAVVMVRARDFFGDPGKKPDKTPDKKPDKKQQAQNTAETQRRLREQAKKGKR